VAALLGPPRRPAFDIGDIVRQHRGALEEELALGPTEQRVLSGGAIGAGGGAVLGAIGGNAGLGAVLGGAAGLAGGYLWDQHKQAEADAYYRGYNDGRRPPPRRR